MRDIFLVVAVVVGLGFTLRFPFVGILMWVWFTLMSPHMEAYGFSQTLPLNLAIAIVTGISWFFSKEPKTLRVHSITVLLLVFLVWLTVNSFFAFAPSFSWPYWDRFWRVFALGFIVSSLATNKIRIEAVLWCAAISLMYYGVKGGLFTLATGGNYRVLGPVGTAIGDNNALALALLMILPVIEYLRSTVTYRALSLTLLGCMALIGIAVLGSYSRGAFIAMAVLGLVAVAQSKRKFLYLSTIGSFAILALLLMPRSFYDRMNTIGSAKTDGSFMGRWTAWQVATKYAIDHFPFGAGFYAPQLRSIYNYYFPAEFPHAAHSIYFQVLGEHGFIGLAIYLAILVMAVLGFWQLARRDLEDTDASWIPKLSRSCLSIIIAFCVGGAALSVAYYDLFIIIICLIPPLTVMADAAALKKRKKSRPASHKVPQAASNPTVNCLRAHDDANSA